MRNPRRTPPVAAMLLFVLLVAGCAAPAGDLASVEDAAGREIARIGAGVPGGRGPAGGEPAGGTLEDGGGNAAGRAGPDASPAPDAPVPYRPIGSGSGGASGGGASGMEPGAIDPAVPVEGAGSSGFAGEASDLLLLYCGEDEDVLGRGRNLNARRCLWDAYLANRAAAFRTVAYTTEGDPIAYHLDVLAQVSRE